MFSRGRRSRYSYWLAMPAVIIYLLFLVIPVAGGLGLSFVRVLGFDLSKAKFAGLLNYRNVLEQSNLLLGIRNSFIFAVVTTVCKVGFGL